MPEPTVPNPAGSQDQETLAELERLRAENARLVAARQPRSRRITLRGVAALICFTLAAVLTAPAVLGFWGQRTLTDPERYLQTVGPLASDPTVQAEVGAVISANLTEKLDITALLQDWLPPRAEPLAGPIAGAVNNFIAKEVDTFLASEQFERLWIEINRVAQGALIRALEADQSGAIQVQGDTVVLDLATLLERVKSELVAKGLTVLEKVPVPPAADRQIVLLQSEQLQQARTIYSISVPIARWLIVGVVILYLLAIGLARRRSRMVVAVGVALIASMILVRVGMALIETTISSSGSTDPSLAATAGVFFNTLTVFLLNAVRTLAFIGLLMVVFGWLFGASRSAADTRRLLSAALSGAGAKAGTTGPLATAGAWVAGKRVPLITAVVALAGLFLVTQDPLTVGTLLLVTLLVLAAVAAVLILAAAAPQQQEAPAEVPAE